MSQVTSPTMPGERADECQGSDEAIEAEEQAPFWTADDIPLSRVQLHGLALGRI